MSIPLPGQIIDLAELFKNTFGTKPYVINKSGEVSGLDGTFVINSTDGLPALTETTPKGSLIAERYLGIEIFLPIRFFDSNASGSLLMYLPYCVLSISGKKTIIKTPLPERVGTVKEQYNIDDYNIVIKGFLISQDRKFPEQEMEDLKKLYEAQQAVTIDNAITNIFLTNPVLDRDEQRRVVIESLEFPEVQGGRKNVRPFVMELESDTVFTLELT
jgi:hypothetical protein